MNYDKLEPVLMAAVKRHHAAAVALCKDLYEHPELPEEEFRSSKKVVELLRGAGYEVEYPYLDIPTSFRGVLGDGGKPHVTIMVEYDALPGIGHGCGHNAHCAMAVLAALALADIRDQFPGTLYVIGTPAEEGAGAKVPLTDRGAFDDMDLAVMNHSWSGGRCMADMSLLGLTCYIIEFNGLSAHAVAGPWEGHSALAAARKFMDLIDARRECFTPDIHVNSIITDGGQAPNILPDKAVIRLEYRADSKGKMEKMDVAVRKCAEAAAMALECTVSFATAFDGFDDMVRVPVLEDAATEFLAQLGYECDPVSAPNGSSDVGNVSYRCPTIQALMSISDTFYALHTKEFRDETIKPRASEGIAAGASLIASMAYRTFMDDEFRSAVRESFREQLEKKSK